MPAGRCKLRRTGNDHCLQPMCATCSHTQPAIATAWPSRMKSARNDSPATSSIVRDNAAQSAYSGVALLAARNSTGICPRPLCGNFFHFCLLGPNVIAGLGPNVPSGPPPNVLSGFGPDVLLGLLAAHLCAPVLTSCAAEQRHSRFCYRRLRLWLGLPCPRLPSARALHAGGRWRARTRLRCAALSRSAARWRVRRC